MMMGETKNVDDGLRLLGVVVAALLLLGSSAPAFAQGSGGGSDKEVRIFLIGAFGGGLDGEIDYSGDAFGQAIDDDQELGPEEGNEDLGWTNGIGGEFHYGFNEYFSVGARLAFNLVKFEDLLGAESARLLFVNIDGVVRGKYPVSGTPVTFYGSVPIGITMNMPNEDYRDYFDDRFPFEDDPRVGTGLSLNISAHIGFQYDLSDRFSFFFEQGLYRQNVTLPGSGELVAGTGELEWVTTAAFNQYEVNAGVSFMF